MGLRDEAKAVAKAEASETAQAIAGDDTYTTAEDVLTAAIRAADWPAVRKIAKHPDTPRDEVDRARGALAGAGQTPVPEYVVGDSVTVGGTEFTKHAELHYAGNGNGRHGVPDTHVYDPAAKTYLDPGANPGALAEQTVAAEPVRRAPVIAQGTPLHLTPQQHAFLLRPISGNRVKQLRGQHYLEAWDVRRTLTRAFGFGGWDLETIDLTLVREIEYPPGATKVVRWNNGNRVMTPNESTIWTVVYRAQVRLTIKNPDGTPGVVFEDGASGDSVNQPSLGDAHDQAMKTALSQGLKRCAANLGDQFGMSLYNGGSYDAVVLGTLAGPVVEGSETVETLTSSAPVRGEQETPEYLSDPGQHGDADPDTGLPTPFALRDEAVNPGTGPDRLRAIYAMVHRSRGTHPSYGPTRITNENNNDEALDHLVHRKIQEVKERLK